MLKACDSTDCDRCMLQLNIHIVAADTARLRTISRFSWGGVPLNLVMTIWISVCQRRETNSYPDCV